MLVLYIRVTAAPLYMTLKKIFSLESHPEDTAAAAVMFD